MVEPLFFTIILGDIMLPTSFLFSFIYFFKNRFLPEFILYKCVIQFWKFICHVQPLVAHELKIYFIYLMIKHKLILQFSVGNRRLF